MKLEIANQASPLKAAACLRHLEEEQTRCALVRFAGSSAQNREHTVITVQGKEAFVRLGLRTQSQTIDMAVQGCRYEEIAELRQVSAVTVKQHLQKARRVLGARSTTSLAALVVQRGWITLDGSAG